MPSHFVLTRAISVEVLLSGDCGCPQLGALSGLAAEWRVHRRYHHRHGAAPWRLRVPADLLEPLSNRVVSARITAAHDFRDRVWG